MANWTLIGTTLSLLVLHSLVDPAHAQMPSIVYPSGRGGPTVEAASRHMRDGAYVFDTAVNGTPLPMIFDTGATNVVLRTEDAERAGININTLSYSIVTRTANGMTRSAPVTLQTLTVGGITRHNVQAAVSRPGELFNSLLGQTFLTRLAGFRRDGDRIVLQGE